MFSPADIATLPFDDWVNGFVRGWLVPNFRPAFRAAQVPISAVLAWTEAFFLFVPMLVTTAAFALASLLALLALVTLVLKTALEWRFSDELAAAGRGH